MSCLRIGVKAFDDRIGLFLAANGCQPAGTVGKFCHGEYEYDGGDGDNGQHHAPVAGIAEGGIGKEGGENTYRDHELVAGYYLAAGVFIGHFG